MTLKIFNTTVFTMSRSHSGRQRRFRRELYRTPHAPPFLKKWCVILHVNLKYNKMTFGCQLYANLQVVLNIVCCLLLFKVWKVHKRGTAQVDSKNKTTYKDVAVVFESVLLYAPNKPVCTLVYWDCTKIGTQVIS